MISVAHRIQGRAAVALGLIRVEGLEVAPANAELVQAIGRSVGQRQQPLPAPDERRRLASRDMLRNGKYKPTGRGKPASEYLLRAAVRGEFPRISGPVDALNLVSLDYLVPISLWDLELAGADEFEFRLGYVGEAYVFNPAGQRLELEDLVCGAACIDGGTRAIVTPIKDSMSAKIQADSRRVAACIYFPLVAGESELLERVTEELAGWLGGYGTVSATATLRAGEQKTV